MFGWILTPLLIGSAMPMAANEPARAIFMEVEQTADTVIVTLRGQSSTSQQVSYELLLEGSSTSRHKGSTQLAAGRESVLSTMTMSAAGSWCVRAKIFEADGLSYEYAEGSCD